MATVVTAPNGDTVEFPDGMSDADIHAAMLKEYGAKQPAPAPAVSQTADLAKSFGTGLAKGAIGLATLPGNMRSLMDEGIARVVSKVRGVDLEKARGDVARASEARAALPGIAGGFAQLPTATDVQGAIEAKTGEFYKPQTTAGKYAETAGEFAPGVMFPGSTAQRVGLNWLAPAIASEAAGQAAEGTGHENAARVVGGLAGPSVARAGMRALTPNPAASAERTRQAEILAREGVETSAGQATGSRALKAAEGAYGDVQFSGKGAAALQERQAEQFTRAALRRIGEDAPRATPEVMDRAFTRIGSTFDDIASRNAMPVDLQLVHDLNRVHQAYTDVVAPSMRAPLVENVLNDLHPAIRSMAAGNTVHIPGASYSTLRSQLNSRAREAADPATQRALFGIQEAMDNAMRRTMSGADAAALDEARRQYRNIIAIEQAARGAGEQAASGIITPAQLRSSIANQNTRAYVRGDGDLNELARAGVTVMTPFPNSGTAARQQATTIPAAIGSAVGAAVSKGLTGDATTGAIIGALAPAAAVPIAGRTLMSGPVQSYLGNQILAEPLRATSAAQGMRAAVPATLADNTEDHRLSENQTYRFLRNQGLDAGSAKELLYDPQKLNSYLRGIAAKAGAAAR